MKLRLFTKLGKTTGQSLVEFAMVLPLLLVLFVGIVDFSFAIRAKNIIINMSREGANLALRSTSIPNQDIMNALASTAGPLDMEKDGMMYVTEVKMLNGVRTVTQEAWKGNSSADGLGSGVNEGNVDDSLGTIQIDNGSSAFVFEVVYKYHSLFLPSYTPDALNSITVF